MFTKKAVNFVIDFKKIMSLHLECIYKTLFNCPNISDCVEATNKEKVFKKISNWIDKKT